MDVILDFLTSCLKTMPSAVAEGIIWGIMAIGVYITYKILDIADLSVDGSMVTGMCVCLVLIRAGVPAPVAMIAAILAGMLAGMVTGLLHTLLGIPAILAGILTQFMLYSINMQIMGGNSTVALIMAIDTPLLHVSDKGVAILVSAIIAAILIVVLWLFFYTQVGLTLKSTGDNPDMSRAQGVNVSFNKVLGLAISNGIVALAGALFAQYKGSAALNDGRGAIVYGLAAIFIGLSVSMKIKSNFVVSLIGVIGGGIVYYMVYNVAVMIFTYLGIDTNFLKMFSAIIVAVFLAVPYLKGRYFAKKKKLPVVASEPIDMTGGEDNA